MYIFSLARPFAAIFGFLFLFFRPGAIQMNPGDTARLPLTTKYSFTSSTRQNAHKRIAKVLLILLLGTLGAGLFIHFEQSQAFLRTLWAISVMKVFLIIGQGLLLINVAALIWRAILVVRYKPIPGVKDHQLPEISVIVPAYNEGREQMLETIRSIVQSNYPREKLHIIAVDDGSRDDTWDGLCEAQQESPEMVQVLRCPKNRGKRHALSEGFARSKGMVLVTIDSDSLITPNTLRNLASPFVVDSRVGAVAGNVRVLNKRGLIPRMLDVTFTFSFDFLRASQSKVNAVMCTPGALSAYRRDLAMKVLPEWRSQRFCGRVAKIGEDRAMTNAILRLGWHVLYQRNAMVLTKVPDKYPQLCRMMLRWARSNVRETLVMSRFAFRKFRETGATGARINLLLSWSALTLSQLLWLPFFIGCLLHPMIIIHTLFGAMTCSLISVTVYLILRKSMEGLWAIPYSVFSLFGLSWITPFAIITPHRSGWLTR